MPFSLIDTPLKISLSSKDTPIGVSVTISFSLISIFFCEISIVSILAIDNVSLLSISIADTEPKLIIKNVRIINSINIRAFLIITPPMFYLKNHLFDIISNELYLFYIFFINSINNLGMTKN